MAEKKFRFILETLSPVHRGCDEVYEPTGFVVNEANSSLALFDPMALVGGLEAQDRRKFSEICKRGTVESILEIYKFVPSHAPEADRFVRACKGFPGHYAKVLGLTPAQFKKELNTFQIQRTAFCSEDQRPYIPGTAVKGALRTAYLNDLAEKGPDYSRELRGLRGKGQNAGAKQKAHRWLEEKLLGLEALRAGEKMSKDPFRMVKVSDFMPVGKVSTKILYAVNKKKKPTDQDARGPTQILETIEPGAVFMGQIVVEEPVVKGAVTENISLDKLLDRARDFFGSEKEREDKELRGIGASSAPSPGNGSVPLRIGRHSGAEFVTIRRYRDIKIMLGKKGNAYQDHATTLWLSSETRKPNSNVGLFPFGWAVLRPLRPEEEGRLASEEKAYRQGRSALWRDRQAKRREAQRLAEEEARRRAEEERRRQEEAVAEAKRRAEREKMSAEELAIDDLRQENTETNRVFEIFREMNGYSEEARREVAGLLKAVWQHEGRWSKKDCSKKQWNKVQKVKEILGEK